MKVRMMRIVGRWILIALAVPVGLVVLLVVLDEIFPGTGELLSGGLGYALGWLVGQLKIRLFRG